MLLEISIPTRFAWIKPASLFREGLSLGDECVPARKWTIWSANSLEKILLILVEYSFFSQ